MMWTHRPISNSVTLPANQIHGLDFLYIPPPPLMLLVCSWRAEPGAFGSTPCWHNQEEEEVSSAVICLNCELQWQKSTRNQALFPNKAWWHGAVTDMTSQIQMMTRLLFLPLHKTWDNIHRIQGLPLGIDDIIWTHGLEWTSHRYIQPIQPTHPTGPGVNHDVLAPLYSIK